MSNELETKDFGKIKYSEDEIITFTQGLPGFEDKIEFILLKSGDDEPFYWLISINDPELTFLTTNPWNFVSDYQFDLPEQDKKKLKIRNMKDILILNIIVLPEDIKEMSINLRAPIVVNINQNLGKQIILPEEKYPIRYYAFKEQIKVED